MTEAERLAERLEEKAHNHTQDDIAEWSYMTEAATLLRAQSARIAALEAKFTDEAEREHAGA